MQRRTTETVDFYGPGTKGDPEIYAESVGMWENSWAIHVPRIAMEIMPNHTPAQIRKAKNCYFGCLESEFSTVYEISRIGQNLAPAVESRNFSKSWNWSYGTRRNRRAVRVLSFRLLPQKKKCRSQVRRWRLEHFNVICNRVTFGAECTECVDLTWTGRECNPDVRAGHTNKKHGKVIYVAVMV